MDSVIESGSELLPEVSREEILKQIFGDIGELIDDFTCAVESTVLVHGRMYITNRFICFYSNLFGLEKKIRIPYSHIKSITKENTAMVIPNAIAISTDKKDYVFRSFWDREDCYRLLTSFLSKYKGNSDVDSYRAKVLLDVAPNSHLVELMADGLAENIEPSATGANPDTAIITDYFVGHSEPAPAPTPSATANSSPTPSRTTADSSGSSKKRLSERPLSERPLSVRLGSAGDADDIYDTESGFRPMSTSIKDLSTSFELEVTKSRLKIVVVADTLPLTVEQFFGLFVHQDAPFSFKKYHETVKDTNLVATPWAELSSSLGCGREIKFFKPVNLPGLASTRGVKVQRFRRFGNLGLVVCSSTRLEDVPAADTFSVEDMVSVRDVDGQSVEVEITFQVSFIKSTYMKYIIERSTNYEMTKWLEAFFTHLRQSTKLFKEGSVQLPEACSEAEASTAEGDCGVAEKEGEGSAQTELDSPARLIAAADLKATVSAASSGKGAFLRSPTADRCRLVVFVLLLVFLVRSNYHWHAVSSHIADLERKVDLLDSLVAQMIASKR